MDASWRVIRARGRPAENMALDVAVAWAVGEGIAPPTLRFYEWDPPAVSLGYAQGEGTLDLEACTRVGLPVVRRPTGGGAVLHGGDLTYAVALPRHRSWGARSVAASCRVIHAAVASGLRRLGVAAEMADPRAGHPPATRGCAACFAALSGSEIAVGGRKLVGSAQRRFRRAILQHGSILLEATQDRLAALLATDRPGPEDEPGKARGPDRRRRAPASPPAMGLAELLGARPAPAAVAAAVAAGFAETFGVRLEDGSFLPAERALADRLEDRFRVGSSAPSPRASGWDAPSALLDLAADCAGGFGERREGPAGETRQAFEAPESS